jgi:lipopolysaccharide/colanic/teichoic acid biosynthesis glycosyltransferase
VDEVFFSLPVNAPYPAELIDLITEMGIVVHVQVEQMYVEEWQHQTVEKFAGTTVRTLSMSMATPHELFWKRALDILGGIVGCLFTLILTVIIGPMIYIKSPGPIFFKQTRVGKNGKLFKMYKFRSMYLDAEARKAELMAQNRVGGGLMFKLDYDPRIIGCEKRPDGTIKKGIGNFIRDYSLDEFPQFFNVLKGDLSLCGTRPPTVDEWEKYELHHRARLAIKPGITGLWQVSGRSNITDFEEVVELDKKYIREWSMGLDLRILLKTVLVVLGKDGSM